MTEEVVADNALDPTPPWLSMSFKDVLSFGDRVVSDDGHEDFPNVEEYFAKLPPFKAKQFQEVLSSSQLSLKSNALDVLFHDNVIVRVYFASTLTSYVEEIHERNRI